MFFSVIVMLVSAIYTIYGLLWVRLFRWTKDAVEASTLLNVDILAQTGALNTQDSLVMMLNDLQISQTFVQNIINWPSANDAYLSNY